MQRQRKSYGTLSATLIDRCPDLPSARWYGATVLQTAKVR
jgi:hypothetical protein